MFRKAVTGLLVTSGALTFGLSACDANGDAGSNGEAESVTKPKIVLMTSLPIVWGDGASMSDIVSGDSGPAPIYEHWQEQYEITAVDSLVDLGKSGSDIVMLVQPRAMAPADLSDLDRWVRAGGNALILTDPALMWHSELPFGSRERPLVSGLLSPLLGHWGLELNAPSELGQGEVELEVRDYKIATAGVGSFAFLPEGQGEGLDCTLTDAGFIALCKMEKGQAIMVADADFIDKAFWLTETASRNGGPSDAMRFVDDLVAEFGHNSPVSKD